MIAYPKNNKAMYIRRIRAHRKADELVGLQRKEDAGV